MSVVVQELVWMDVDIALFNEYDGQGVRTRVVL